MPKILIIGDGQLARMLHTEAIELGLSLRVLANSPTESAAAICGDVILGDYHDEATVKAAATGVDVITFEHEHVPAHIIDNLIRDGYNVQPHGDALIHAQDKLVMRRALRNAGAPVPPFAPIDSTDDARAFWEAMDGAVCLKARTGGYDGKGVWFPDSLDELEQLVAEQLDHNTPLMAEKKVHLNRELSALIARSPRGEVRCWDIAETNQDGGVCRWAQAPAANVDAEKIETFATGIAETLDVTGVLAVELFDTDEGIFVNELAMRPHNTGHWTQNGATTSQFEQHLRAVANLPLGSTDMTCAHAVMANILGGDTTWDHDLGERIATVWRSYPDAKIHLYGKQHRPGRKLGHINLTGSDPIAVRADALAAAHYIAHGHWPA
ncbi:phosphoribosylaminoimidazole carboxylase [Corynebacterium aquilae DSM 44791]|uniref:N5-carboxyaminoimidazole ribonucleotide synthase n=1 Tax=Corynebacterium aquilae DSM 44791 TaxID=1431546 RepID=A0A1L7CEA1_9CORY|nr:phosphoribosylaminoimidazole carboxylase [Corynebacterium aquilae DSM 44791]